MYTIGPSGWCTYTWDDQPNCGRREQRSLFTIITVSRPFSLSEREHLFGKKRGGVGLFCSCLLFATLRFWHLLFFGLRRRRAGRVFLFLSSSFFSMFLALTFSCCFFKSRSSFLFTRSCLLCTSLSLQGVHTLLITPRTGVCPSLSSSIFYHFSPNIHSLSLALS